MFDTSFDRYEYHEFCNWKTILCKTNKGAHKHLLKVTAQESIFQWSYTLEAYNVIEKGPMSLA